MAKEFLEVAKLALAKWHLCPDIWGEWLQEAMNCELRLPTSEKMSSKNQAQRTLRYAEAFVHKAEDVRK